MVVDASVPNHGWWKPRKGLLKVRNQQMMMAAEVTNYWIETDCGDAIFE